VTRIEVSVAEFTSKVAVAVTEPSCAVMVTAPADSPVAPPVRATAIWGFEEDQVHKAFTFSLLPSVNVAIAVYSIPEAGAISAVAGLNAIEASVAELTVSRVVPVALAPAKLNFALMLVVPALTPTVKPPFPRLLTTVATAVLLELQATCPVRSWLEESLNTPVAEKRSAPPLGKVTLAGEITIEVMVALVTVNGAEALTGPRVALMLAVPGEMPNATALDRLTIEVSEDVQVT